MAITLPIIFNSDSEHETLWKSGYAHAEKGDYDKAIEDFTNILKIKPEDYETLTCRGDSYRAKREYDQAVRDYTAALKIKPDYHHTLIKRGNV